MSAATFRSASQVLGNPVYIAVEFQSYDPVGDTTATYYVTDKPGGIQTESTDIPASVGYRQALTGGWSTTRRASTTNTFQGRGSRAPGSIRIVNVQADGEAILDGWQDLRWNGQPIAIKVGCEYEDDGSAYAFSDFYEYYSGKIDRIYPNDDGTMTIEIAAENAEADRLFSQTVYRGFGGAARLLENDGHLRTGAQPAYATSDMTFEWFGVVRSLPPSSSRAGIMFESSGRLGVTIDDAGEVQAIDVDTGGGTGTTSVDFPTGYVVDLDRPLYISCVGEDDGSSGTDVTIYAGSDPTNVEVIHTRNVPGQPSGSPRIRSNFASTIAESCDLDVWEMRVWLESRTEAELFETMSQTLFDPTSYANLRNCWKFNDGTGATVVDEVGNDDLDLTVTSSPGFIASGEGDDPEQFPSTSLVGKRKPRAVGTCMNVPMTLVSSQFNTYQFSETTWREIGGGFSPTLLKPNDIYRLRIDGSPLVPKKDTNITGASVDGTANTITLAKTAGHIYGPFIYYVPGQTAPARTGQKIVLTNMGANNGTYEIAPEGINSDGTVMTLQAVGGGSPGLTTATAGLSANLASDPTEEQWEHDGFISEGLANLTDAATGEVTADVQGQGGSGSEDLVTLATLALGIGSASLAGGGNFGSRESGYFAGLDNRVTGGQVADLCAQSLFASWYLVRSPGAATAIVFNVFGDPDDPAAFGAAQGHLLGSNASSLTLSDPVLAIGRVQRIQGYRNQIPNSQVKVGYQRVWSFNSSLVTSVSEADRERWSPSNRNNLDLRDPDAQQDDPAFLTTSRSYDILEEWPDAIAAPMVQTLFHNRSDAEAALEYAAVLLTREVRFLDIVTDGLGLITVDVFDPVFIEHPDPTYGITAGEKAIVYGVNESVSDGEILTTVYF